MLPGKKITPGDVLQMVRRRIWLLALPPFVGLVSALVYSATIPNVYQSDMLIAIDPQRVPNAFVQSTVTLETDRRMDAITVQVLSRTNLEEMINRFDLYPRERQMMPIDDVVAIMRKNIQVSMDFARPRWGSPTAPTSFHVRFTHSDPNIAAQVTEQLGSLFVEQNVRDRRALAGATSKFLEAQREEARQKLVEQERKLEAFRERHGPELPTQMQSNLQTLQAKQMQAQGLVESMARDRDRKLMLDRLYRDALKEASAAASASAAAPATGGAAGTQLASAGSFEQQLLTARASLASLELRYTPMHPDVVRARRLVEELEPKAAAEAAAMAAASAAVTNPQAPVAVVDPALRENLRQMAAELESLDRQMAFKEGEERRIREEIAEYQRRVEAVPGLESEFVALTRDYDTQQAAYRDLLAKSNAAQVSSELEQQEIGERFRVVDSARVPVNPMPSMRLRFNLIGLVLGILLGFGAAAFLEFRDASFRSDADVLEVLSLPVLASVPHIETTREREHRRIRTMWLTAAGAVCLAGVGYLTWTLKLWNSLV